MRPHIFQRIPDIHPEKIPYLSRLDSFPYQRERMIVNKRFWIGLAKYGLGLGLLAFVIWRNWAPSADGSSPGIAGVIEKPIQVGPLALAFSICLASVLLTFLRWYVLVRAQDLPFTRINAMRLGLIGYFLSTFLPGSVGGDIIKATCIAREQQRRTVAVATVLVDRAVGLWALFWLVALLGAVFWLAGEAAIHEQPNLQFVVWGSMGLVGVTTLMWCFLVLLPQRNARRLAVRLNAIPRIGHTLAELWRATWMYRSKWRSLLAALLMSLVSHCGFVLTFYYCAQTFLDPAQLDQIPSLAEHFLIVPIGMTVQALCPSPGGVGFGELGFAGLYHMVGKSALNGGVGAFTQRLITLVLSLVGYLVYLRMRSEVRVIQQEKAEEPEEPPTDRVDLPAVVMERMRDPVAVKE